MEPVGVVGIFTPWNSSAGSIAIKVAPAIAAGCTVVKHARTGGSGHVGALGNC